MKQKIDSKFLKLLKSVKNKRARIVIDHILKYGHVTTEQLKNDYGYDHPPRAARDVRELGIPLETFKITSLDKKSIAAYKFGDLDKIDNGKLGGRKVFPKGLQSALFEMNNGRCFVCNTTFEKRYLQIDHRVPYEVAGDKNHNFMVSDYMLLCGSCNRSKSWSCEHCSNWEKKKSSKVCKECYWSNPEKYSHIAMVSSRRIDVTWQGDEVSDFDYLAEQAKSTSKYPSMIVKDIISDYITKIKK